MNIRQYIFEVYYLSFLVYLIYLAISIYFLIYPSIIKMDHISQSCMSYYHTYLITLGKIIFYSI